MNDLKSRLARGDAVVGCFVGLGSPEVVETLGHGGLDFLVIEMEHNAVDLAALQEMLRAAAVVGVPCLVRVPAPAEHWIQRVLDLGADGLLLPLASSPEQVAGWIAQTRYPPAGTRSFGGLRAGGYSAEHEAYFRSADRDILLGCILETEAVVTGIDAVLSLPGLDFITIGPMDLALSFGLDPFSPGPALDNIMQLLVDAALESGVCWGAVVGPDVDVEAVTRAQIRIIGSDYSFLLQRARDVKARFGTAAASGVTVRSGS